jgi:hypothetical protein
MFAAITGFLYEENEVTGMGIGCIRLLNEILISFDKVSFYILCKVCLYDTCFIRSVLRHLFYKVYEVS